MRIAAVGAVALLLGAGSGAPSQEYDREAVREASALANEAYGRKDYAGFLRHGRALARLAPRSPRALYNLACAQSLTGDAEGAADTLGRLADWGVSFDLDADPDFDGVRGAAAFRAVRLRMKALDEPVGSSAVAFALPERDLLAEGVAHDPRTGHFFVSGVHRRKIVRVDGEGRAVDFVHEGQQGLGAATGIVADPSRRALWVASEASPLMTGYRREDEGRSHLLEFDLDDGRLRRRLEPPIPDGRLSDLALGPDGTIYAADPGAGRVYRLAPGGTRLEVLVPDGTIVSAQGMAAEKTALFVSDYARGLFRVDLATGAVGLLEPPEDLLTSGTDGLVLAGDSLVGIQNGFRPHRVVRWRLDPSHTRILGGEVLVRAHPRFDEPTLGVLVGGELFFVANSQYRHFGRDGTPDLEHLAEPVVLRLTLPWLATR